MLTFEFNCPKCNTPIPINQETTQADCPGCGVNIVFEDEQHVMDSASAAQGIDLYQTDQQQSVDNSGKLNETITVSFSRSDIYDGIPGAQASPGATKAPTAGSNILNPGVAKAKRLGSLKVAEPVKDSIFGGAATGASGIFKNAGVAAAKPIGGTQPPASAASGQMSIPPQVAPSAASGQTAIPPQMPQSSADSLGGINLEDIQRKAMEEVQKQLQAEIEKQQAMQEEIRQQAYEQAKKELMEKAEQEAKQKAEEEA
ncbi:MAG: hypothetical protein NE327_11475, partial [Lentisphaeraceae bacterium]|nr:hypothetical protein [Lentisphaeraceae bacterium]